MPRLPESPDRQRLDKWLFYARVAKSRSLAARLVEAGHVRVDGDKKRQPSFAIHAGNVLTIVLERRVLVLRILDCGVRRGPANEAAGLYEDLSPPAIEGRRTPSG